jgi:hypothetical protein
MALTLVVRMEATILDHLDVQATCSAYAMVDPTASFATIIGTMATWLADLDACTDGQIISSELEVLPALPGGLKGSPVSTSRVEQTGILNFVATGDTHLSGFAIPALSDGATVISAGKIVLTEDAPVEVMIDLLAGGGTVSLAWTNEVSQALASFANALISFRQYRKQLSRSTYERS